MSKKKSWTRVRVFLIACSRASLVVICLCLQSLIDRRANTAHNTLQRSTFLSGRRPPTLSVFVFMFLSLLLVCVDLLALVFFLLSLLYSVFLVLSCVSFLFLSFSVLLLSLFSLLVGLSLDSLSLDRSLICVLRIH